MTSSGRDVRQNTQGTFQQRAVEERTEGFGSWQVTLGKADNLPPCHSHTIAQHWREKATEILSKGRKQVCNPHEHCRQVHERLSDLVLQLPPRPLAGNTAGLNKSCFLPFNVCMETQALNQACYNVYQQYFASCARLETCTKPKFYYGYKQGR